LQKRNEEVKEQQIFMLVFYCQQINKSRSDHDFPLFFLFYFFFLLFLFGFFHPQANILVLALRSINIFLD